MAGRQDGSEHSFGDRPSMSCRGDSRKSVRGVSVAPHVVSPPKRSNSVLHNIRGRSLPFATNCGSPRVHDKQVYQQSQEPFPIRSDVQRVKSCPNTSRGLSTQTLNTLDSLVVVWQDGDRSSLSSHGQTTSSSPTRTDSKGEPRRNSYVMARGGPSSPVKCLRQATSLNNFRELSTMIPKLPGTIEGSPEKTKTFGGGLAVLDVAPKSEKRDVFTVSLVPKPEQLPSRFVTALTFFKYSLAPLYDIWERLQVSHCGQYSVERMLALDEYCQRVSMGRVLAVCLLFPLGPLLVVVLTECMPLQPVEKGPLANYVFWIRHTLMGVLLVICAMVQAKSWIPDVTMTMKQVFVVAIGSAFIYTASNIILADLWVFPLPFLVVAGAPLMFSIWAIMSRLVLGPRPLEGLQDGEFHGRRFLLLTSVHASLLGLYPAYQAVFLMVDGLQQLAMVALLPALNLALKNLQTAIGSHFEDNLPEVIIFSVDVFSAIYSVLCMHSANSMQMVAITLVLNTSVMLLSLHGMNRRSRVARACQSFQFMERQQQKLRRRQSVIDSVVTGGGVPALLSTLVNTMLELLQAPGQLDTTELRTIRLLSGMPQQLADEGNVALLETLTARCVYNNSRRMSEIISVAQIKERYSSAAMDLLSVSHFHIPSPPRRSKLMRRVRGAGLVISTIHWLSVRFSSEARTESIRLRPETRESTSKSTESEESEAEKFTRQLSSISSQGSTVVVDLATAAPQISQLIHASSDALPKSTAHQKSTPRRSIPALWQETLEKVAPPVVTSNAVLSNVLDETQKQNTRAVKQTLQLLFNSEYLGLIAYTQCIIPVIYLLYMPVLQALPNHVYYPTHYRYFGDSPEFHERMTVIGILALMQVLVLVTLQAFVATRFGISTMYQVAFVLESRFVLLQGRLLMWLIFAVQSTLVHYGVDFTFRFDWLKN